jgi:hypothetical protein
MESFFESPLKGDYKVDLKKTRLGYYEFGSENGKGYSQKNHMEFYQYTVGHALPSLMGYKTEELFNQLIELGREILGWLDQTLPEEIRRELPCQARNMMPEAWPNMMRIIHYPPLERVEKHARVLNSEHEDLNLITLLCGSTAPGLEVKDLEGNWHRVGYDPESVIVNVADCLEFVTQGYLKSTPHRVVCPEGFQGHRYSIPCFIGAKEDLPVAENLTAGQFLLQRLQEIGIL